MSVTPFNLIDQYAKLRNPDDAAREARIEAQQKMDRLLFEVECMLINLENNNFDQFRSATEREIDDLHIGMLERLRDNLTGRGAQLLTRYLSIMPARLTS